MLMWTSVAASGFGDRIVQMSAWELTGISRAGNEPAQITAAITFFFMLPYVLFGLLGGWLADTLPRKWVMLFCDETRAAILLLAVAIVPATVAGAIDAPHFWKVYAIVFGTGTLAAIFSPTKAAVMPQIVPIGQLQAANAIVLGIAVIASMIGFKVGDSIIEHQSVRGGLWYAFLSFAISGCFFAFLKIRKRAAPAVGERYGQVRRVVQAAGYIRRHRPVLLLILQSVAFWVAAHLFLNAIGVLCVQNYGIAPDQVRSRIAEMSMVVGIGMLASAFWVAWMSTRRESTWVALGGLFMAGVFMFLMAINRSYVLGLILGFGAGFFGNTAMIAVVALTQSITPNYIRGRVFGVRDIVITITAVVVNLVIWRVPGSNAWMIPSLLAISIVLTVGSSFGLWIELRRGPLPNRTANVLWHWLRLFVLVWHRLRWVGRANIPDQGPVILAANHTTALDPFLIQTGCRRLVRWLMMTRYHYFFAAPLWHAIDPITMDGASRDLSKIRQVIRVLDEGKVVGLFPEGGLQRTHRNLQPFQDGIAMIAQRTGAWIVPVWITGTPRRQHMVWHFFQPTRSVVIYGQPFTADPSQSHQQVMDELRQRMLALADQAERSPGGGTRR